MYETTSITYHIIYSDNSDYSAYQSLREEKRYTKEQIEQIVLDSTIFI